MVAAVEVRKGGEDRLSTPQPVLPGARPRSFKSIAPRLAKRLWLMGQCLCRTAMLAIVVAWLMLRL
jgi:hypothetical protein